MKKWITEIRAIDPRTGEMALWGGPSVSAPSLELAQQWCNENAGYLKVIGELITEIPCKPGTMEPDWENRIDYDTPSLN